MKIVLAALAGTTALVIAGSSLAADVALPVASPAAPAVVAPAGFDWSGLYAGIVGGVWLPFEGVEFEGEPVGSTMRLGGVVGANFLVGERLVLGAEVQLSVYDFADPTFEAFAIGHAGVLLGNRALAFGSLGLAWDAAEGAGGAMVAGGGIEFAVGERVSLRAEALAYKYFDAPFEYVTLTGGIILHLGR